MLTDSRQTWLCIIVIVKISYKWINFLFLFARAVARADLFWILLPSPQLSVYFRLEARDELYQVVNDVKVVDS